MKKIAAGTQRAVTIIGEDGTGIMDHVQGWLDDGWRFLGLTYLAADEESAIRELATVVKGEQRRAKKEPPP